MISVRLSNKLATKIMKIISDGNEKDGKNTQVSKEREIIITDKDPTIKIKYLRKSVYEYSYLN
jgi:hypothetical protein